MEKIKVGKYVIISKKFKEEYFYHSIPMRVNGIDNKIGDCALLIVDYDFSSFYDDDKIHNEIHSDWIEYYPSRKEKLNRLINEK